MKIFIGAAASNTHLHQIGQAMDEAGFLSDYLVPCGGIPLHHPVVLARRSPVGIPKSKLLQHPGWEITRLAASKLGLPSPWVDLIWEQGELSFDRACSHLVASRRPNVFLGVEHSSLESLRTARRGGIAAGLIYTSLHHKFREKWLNPELDRFPELLSPASRVIRSRDARRDERRDEEMNSADFIHANSAVTAQSLVEAGFPADRIITVPLGAPPAADEQDLPARPSFPSQGHFCRQCRPPQGRPPPPGGVGENRSLRECATRPLRRLGAPRKFPDGWPKAVCMSMGGFRQRRSAP